MRRWPRLLAAARVLLATCVACCVGAGVRPSPADRLAPRTHAHNDYEHPHPLFDALRQGFVSVEADVYLVGNDLRVSHDVTKDWAAVPTLQDAYLSPLRDLVRRRHNGGVYADGTPLFLLVDIKTDAGPTYARLHEILAEYQAATPGMFTAYTVGRDGRAAAKPGAITVVVSGNRPREAMKKQATRLAGYDGRLADVGGGDDGAFMPWVSDNWNNVLTGEAAWDGTGEPSAAAREKLKALAARVHAERKLLRLWNLPKDAPAVWGVLWESGVDLINTDDLAGLAAFVASRAPAAKGKPD